jgi:hypothetical protein
MTMSIHAINVLPILVTEASHRDLKQDLRNQIAGVKPTHLAEAIAKGLGYGTSAGLSLALRGPDVIHAIPDDFAFRVRLSELGGRADPGVFWNACLATHPSNNWTWKRYSVRIEEATSRSLVTGETVHYGWSAEATYGDVTVVVTPDDLGQPLNSIDDISLALRRKANDLMVERLIQMGRVDEANSLRNEIMGVIDAIGRRSDPDPDPRFAFVKAMGLEVREDSDQPGLWLWIDRLGEGADHSFATKEEALADATEHATDLAFEFWAGDDRGAFESAPWPVKTAFATFVMTAIKSAGNGTDVTPKPVG